MPSCPKARPNWVGRFRSTLPRPRECASSGCPGRCTGNRTGLSTRSPPAPAQGTAGSLLLAEEHRVVLAGRIVHGHYQVPDAPRHPLVGTAVLVDHHARQWRRLPALAMLAALRATLYQTLRLQGVLDPRVAPASAGAAVPGMKVANFPALTGLIKSHQSGLLLPSCPLHEPLQKTDSLCAA